MQIRTFEGTASELADFVGGVWAAAYRQRMPFPCWTAEYFDWHFGLSDGGDRTHLIAGYDEHRLAAVILGLPLQFRTPNGLTSGILSSWLSIVPEFRGQGLVAALKAEQARRVRESGGKIIQAYRYLGSRHSLSRPARASDLASGNWSVRNVGFWIRVLDASRAANWYVDTFSRWSTRLSAPFIRAPRPRDGTNGVRDFEESDLEQCLSVVETAGEHCDFAVHWTKETLGRQLCQRRCGRCLVSESQGAIQGLISWHVLPFEAATRELVGVIDLIAVENLNRRERRRLMNAALAEMRATGAVLALKVRVGDCPGSTMYATGFVPWFADSQETVRCLDGAERLPLKRPHHVLWR